MLTNWMPLPDQPADAALSGGDKKSGPRSAQELLTLIEPALEDVLWCALIWNDHNFEYRHLHDRLDRAAKALGFTRMKSLDGVNALLSEIHDATMRIKEDHHA